MEIIDLSSDDEDIIDLCSDREDNADLCSDGEDSLDFHDPRKCFRQPLRSLSLNTDQDSDDEPIKLEVDFFLSNYQASSVYRPAENRPATEKMTKLKSQDFRPSMPSMASVIDVEVDDGPENLEKNLFGFDEKAVYEEALQNMGQEKREEDLPDGVMSVSLLKHQKIALAWMISRENSSRCSGGILADDQGLGKTISTIALIQKERVQQSTFKTAEPYGVDSVEDHDEAAITKPAAARITKTIKAQPRKKTRVSSSASTLSSMSRPAAGTLVVCPASVLRQWANELSAKVTESAKLSVLVYHGGSRTRDQTELADYDVVVTTYTIVAREVPNENTDDEENNSEMYEICPNFSVRNKIKLQKSARSKTKKKKKSNSSGIGPLGLVRWFRVVLDEAHTIKCYQTQIAKACCGLSTERRWCLSGTPMQNRIDDLYSYFRFLKYEPYSKFSSFCTMIKNPVFKDPIHGYKKLQTVLRIVLLRRTKEMLLDGEPIIKLPPKTIQLSRIDFTEEERAFYASLEKNTRQKLRAYTAQQMKKQYVHILALLTQLRQTCNHPFLLKKGQQSETRSIEMAKKLPKDTVTNLLEKLETVEPPEEAVVATCGHVFCYQCVVHQSLSCDENICPSPLCGKEISFESVFSAEVLKRCMMPEFEPDAKTSCATAAEKSSSICESSYVSSKIRAVIDKLNSIINTGPLTGDCGSISNEVAPVKTIIFTQWTGMLDLLELSLSSNHIEFRRLDGSMSLNIRE
ncbi:hypothetical protein ACP70R_010905 [Stipagrostis hirtigluma subsp. patula]